MNKEATRDNNYANPIIAITKVLSTTVISCLQQRVSRVCVYCVVGVQGRPSQ